MRSTKTTTKSRKFGRLLGVGLALTLAAGALIAPDAGAATSDPGAPAVSTPGTSWQDLKTRATRDGKVSVIVSLQSDGSQSRVAGANKMGTGHVTVTDTATTHFRNTRKGLLSRFRRQPTAVNALDGAPFMSMSVDAAQLDTLRQSAEVTSVKVNEVHDAAGTSYNGSAAGQQLGSMWDYSRIGADWANNNGWTGKGMKVAVIDTGVDRSNPYLSGRVTNEACFATFTNGAGACAGNQKWVYSATAPGGIVGSATPCTYSTSCAHGTHTAHTAAGMYGTARGASIIAIQASHYEWDATTSQYVPRFNDSDLMNALWYVQSILPKLNIVAASVNMSIGGGGSTGYCDSTSTNSVTYWINQLLTSYQIPVVISSGNNNYSNMVSSPACNSNAISVGNTTLSGTVDAVYGGITGGSNSNATLDLLAPGTDICSAVPASLDVDGVKDGWACGWIGTSMAAPHVAGALAILTQKRPSATVAQMVAALQRSGSTGGVAVTDSRNNITRTRIRVDNAVYYF